MILWALAIVLLFMAPPLGVLAILLILLMGRW